MARASHSQPPEDPERTLFTTTLGRLVLTLCAIAAIIYAATLTISRTDGFREIVKEQISEKIGMQTAVDSVSINRRLQLILEGISLSPRAGEDTPAGVKVAKATVSFRIFSVLRMKRLRLEGAEFVFATDDLANIRPQQMAPLSVAVGDILEAASSTRKPANSDRTARPKAREILNALLEKTFILEMDSAAIEWNSLDGSMIERWEDIDLTASPFATRHGTAYYIHFAATFIRHHLDNRGRITAELIRMPNAGLHLIDSQLTNSILSRTLPPIKTKLK